MTIGISIKTKHVAYNMKLFVYFLLNTVVAICCLKVSLLAKE